MPASRSWRIAAAVANGAILEKAGARDGVPPLDQVPIALRGCGRVNRDERKQRVRAYRAHARPTFIASSI
ncbi:MAG TPA: hypothetical protein VFB63_22520 [Bryobacteraceae bacterium]|nr:hypothetical protein [Bryobacteraceae bacterium]